MKTKFLSLAVLIGAAAVSWAIISAALVLAQEGRAGGGSATQIQYPVPELGNCKSEDDCRSYCDKPANLSACLDFAEKHDLMPKEELNKARKFEQAGGKGPGSCRGKNECDTFCNDIANIDECVSFAEKNGMMSPKELEEAKKVQAAIKRGVKPPPCKNKNECDVFCSEPDNMEQCMNFALEAGFMDEREKQDAQKMLAALKQGVKPPPCRGKNECDAYCSQPENMETCMSFAIAAGMMDEKQKEESQRVLAAIKKGVKPPACRGPQECDAYCSSDEHFQECLNFAEAAGFMKPEEAKMARKTGGKGPGGCRKKEECEAFCNNPDNQETCFNFAKENGMIRPEELQKMEEGKQRFKESLSNAPDTVKTCLRDSFGADQFAKFESGAAMPSPQTGDKMRECFEKFMGPPGPMGASGQPGPGTMQNFDQMPQEARDCFLSKLGESWQDKIKEGPPGSEVQECFQKMGGPNDPMQGPDGQVMPGGGSMSGPGGCKTPEECGAYCKEHEEECKNFGPGQNQGGQVNPFGPMPQGQMQPGGPDFTGRASCNSPEECQKLEQEMRKQFSNMPGLEECAKDPSKCIPPAEGFMEKYRNLAPGGRPPAEGQMPQGFPAQPGQPMPGGTQPPMQPGIFLQPMPPSGSPEINFQAPQGQIPIMPQSQPVGQEPPPGSFVPPPPSGENPPPPPSSSAPIRFLVGLVYNLFFPVLK